MFVMAVSLFLALHGLSGSAEATPQSARHFVEEFYRWYTLIALRDNGTATAWSIALKEKPTLFCPTLRRALDRDIAAISEARGLAALDYDPFLDTQDPGEHYDISRVRRKDQTYLIDVYRLESGMRTTKQPQVIAELQITGDRWCFVNFRYADGRDLVNELRKYEVERTRQTEK